MIFRRRGLAILVLMLGVMVGCSSDSGGGADGGSDSVADDLGIIVDPIKVTLTLDENSAASDTVGPQGGTVSTTAQNGTTYTLVIPPGALISEEEISLTPVTGMDGLPLSGGLVGAVDFTPDGLELYAAAILTIQAMGTIESGEFETVGLAYSGDGEELHLFPMSVEGDTITMEIYHFSGYGGGQGTADEVEDMAENRAPSDPNAQTENAAVTERSREEAVKWAELKWIQVIEPLLKEGLENEVKLLKGYNYFNAWLTVLNQYEARLHKGIEEMVASGYELLGAGVFRAGEKAHARCVENKDPSEVLKIFHWIAFAERDNRIARNAYLDVLNDLARKCATFELEFVSGFEYSFGGIELFYKLSTGKIQMVPILPDSKLGIPAPSVIKFKNVVADLIWEMGYRSPPACLGGIDAQGGIDKLINSVFKIVTLQIDVKADSGEQTIDIIYSPGVPREEWTFACPEGTFSFVSYGWLDLFCDTRDSLNELKQIGRHCVYEQDTYELRVKVDNWDIKETSEIYAQRKYTDFSETTTITIYHTPQP